MSKIELPDDWKRLAEESLALSGISPARIDSSLRARHFDAALILSRAVQFVDPRIINGVLTGRRGGWFRDGIASNLRGKAPEGELIPAFFEIWLSEVYKGLAAANVAGHEWTKKRRAVFAWVAHDKLTLMRPFKEANGRTAHLTLNHLRTLLGLPVYVVEYKDEREYFKHQKRYRRDVFIPWMQQQSVIMRKRLAFAELCREKAR